MPDLLDAPPAPAPPAVSFRTVRPRAATPETTRPVPAPARRPTAADLPAAAVLLEDLFGPVPLDRVVWAPFPGTATYEDCVRFNEAGHLCELVDGVLLEKAVGWNESRIALRVSKRMRDYDPDERRGVDTGADGFVELSPDRVRGPDYSFYAWARFPGGRLPGNDRKIPRLAPDFCVEILSESNTRREIDGKLDDLFAAGCRLAWVVDPVARTARVVTPAPEEAAPAGAAPDAANGPAEDDVHPWVETTVGEDAVLAGDPVLPGFSVTLADLLAVPAAPDAAPPAAV